MSSNFIISGATVALASINGPLDVKISSQSIEKTTLEVLFSSKGGKPSVKDRWDLRSLVAVRHLEAV